MADTTRGLTTEPDVPQFATVAEWVAAGSPPDASIGVPTSVSRAETVKPIATTTTTPKPDFTTPQTTELREQELRQALEFAERVARGEITDIPPEIAIQQFGQEYQQSVEDIQAKLAALEQARRAEQSWVTAGRDIPTETQKQIDAAKALALSPASPFIDLAKGTIDVASALRAGVKDEDLRDIGIPQTTIVSTRQRIQAVGRAREVQQKVTEIRRADLEESRLTAQQTLAEFEASLPTLPKVLRDAYATGGVDGYNQAVADYNETLRIASAVFPPKGESTWISEEMSEKAHSPEFREKYIAIVQPAGMSDADYNKLKPYISPAGFDTGKAITEDVPITLIEQFTGLDLTGPPAPEMGLLPAPAALGERWPKGIPSSPPKGFPSDADFAEMTTVQKLDLARTGDVRAMFGVTTWEAGLQRAGVKLGLEKPLEAATTKLIPALDPVYQDIKLRLSADPDNKSVQQEMDAYWERYGRAALQTVAVVSAFPAVIATPAIPAITGGLLLRAGALVPRLAAQIMLHSLKYAPAVYAAASIAETTRAGDFDRQWQKFRTLSEGQQDSWAKRAGFDRSFTSLTDTQKSAVLLRYTAPPSVTLSEWQEGIGKIVEGAASETQRLAGMYRKNLDPVGANVAAFLTWLAEGALVELPAYAAMLPTIVAQIADQAPEGKAAPYALAAALGFAAFFQSIPGDIRKDPVRLGRYIGLFLGPKGTVRAVVKSLGKIKGAANIQGVGKTASVLQRAMKAMADEGGYIRLPSTTRSVVNRIRSQYRISEAQARSLNRVLDDIQSAIKDRNQVKLYDVGRSLLRLAEEIGDPTLLNYARDIVSNPRSYIVGSAQATRANELSSFAEKVQKADETATKATQPTTKTLTAKDVGLTEVQFAEFLKQRAKNPKLTPEQFKKSLMPEPETDWGEVVDNLTKDFNKRLKEEATRKAEVREREFKESQTILRRIREQLDKKAAIEKAAKEKRAKELEELRRGQVEKAKEGYDPEYARKVGEINKEIREHLREIKERTEKLEKQKQAVEEAVKAAEKTENKEKVKEATKLKEELAAMLGELQQAQTATETELEESVELLTELQTQLQEATELEEETATGLEEELEEAVEESTKELQKPKEETRTEEELETVLITPHIPVPEIPPDIPVPEIPPDIPPEEPAPPGTPPDIPPPDVPLIEPSTEKPPPKKPPVGAPSTTDTVGEEVKLPPGSIAWRQGMFWKYIPPPFDQDKAITLPKGVTPMGAIKTDLRTPGETIQRIGETGAEVPRTISKDLGVFDLEISDYGRTIEFVAGGERTNVGRSLESTTRGMSVPSKGISRPAIGTVKPARSVSRTAIVATERPDRVEQDTTVRGVNRPEVIEERKRVARRRIESAEVRRVEPDKKDTDLLFDEDPEWLAQFGGATNKPVNRSKFRKTAPRRVERRDNLPTMVKGVRL